MPADESPHGRGARHLSRRSLVIALIAVVASVLIAAVLVPLAMTSTPGFFARYHLLERRYMNLETSAHEGIGCRSCHQREPLLNGAQLVRDFYISTVKKPTKLPLNFTFRPPTNDACLSCHLDDWSDDASQTANIPHPAHQRVATEKRSCVKCHKWTAHFEPYIAKHKKMPFSGVCVAYGCHVGVKTTGQCFECHHVLHEKGEQWRSEHPRTVSRIGQSACLERCHTVAQCQQCHTTGVRPRFDGLPIEIEMKSIEVKHVKRDWSTSTHGEEALVDSSRCLRCHQTEGYCDECHLERPAFHGSVKTWIGRHKKITSDLKDKRCLACHENAWCDRCHKQFKEME